MKIRKKIVLALGSIFLTYFLYPTDNDVYASEIEENVTRAYLLEEKLPSSVDLSQDEYFPAVGDQSFNGNCGYWSGYYTSFTYAYNKKHGIKTTWDTSHNPIFGFAFYGRSKEDAEKIAMEIGYPTFAALPLDHYGTNTFSPTEQVWEDALRHRTDGWDNYKKFGDDDSVITGPKDSSLNQIKSLLANDLVVGVGSLSAKWNYSVVGDGKYKGETIIDRCDGTGYGGHGISFVGYDDDIWVDINHDGQKQQAEFGAFKMINSWGADWENDGFVWVAYDALNKVSQVLTSADQTRINNAIDAGTIKGKKVSSIDRTSYFMYETVSTIRTREKETSDCLCYMTVNTGSRKEMTMSVTATNKVNGAVATYNFPSLIYDSDNYAWDGTEKSTDATMIFDLDNVISDITPETMEDYTWKVTFGDETLDDRALTVKDVHFKVNGVKKYLTSVSKVPLNGNKRTYEMVVRTNSYKEDSAITSENAKNVTIYYSNSSYKDANIHYRVGSGTWTTAPGVQMCVDDSQDGYTWKFVVNLGTSSTLTACFNNGNGTWDNNSSKDYVISSAGCYGINNGKIVKLEEVEEAEEPIIELDKSEATVYVGDKVTVKADIWPLESSSKKVTWTSSNTSIATVSNGVITGVKFGTATITATVEGGNTATINVTVKENNKLSGVCKASDGSWYYYKNGVIDTSYTGLSQNKYGWWYVNKGKVDFTYTGLVQNKYGWWYVEKGKIDFTHTGLVQNKYGWWYVNKGKVDFTYTGLVQNKYGWWYVEKGKINFTHTGLVQNKYGWWYVEKGKIDFTHTGLVQNKYGWWYVNKGKVDFTYTGLAQNKYGWWYVNKGKVDFTYTGLSQNKYGWWYVDKGKINLTYTGKVICNGITYNVINGKVNK